jgi:hypothetical protein
MHVNLEPGATNNALYEYVMCKDYATYSMVSV